ncbi:MAG: molecular chaperone DjlA [Azospirillum brasilense]|uniref:Molecular chaperone DjlA n=1 Tax=Roseomonas gilardii TaxID=257708 RepID=A0A1L7AGP0_9PROT|nr:TerB family tellurite resistance protein [Roseomonas gilardii]APT57944.1 molecular chaperone DjlA [Roseomonas gilardii]PZR17048.1 MAG: molecular chaperone DjlA [Azospirillum brasilense]
MGFWGKIIGSALGFAVGGPFGAMLGASLGHAADEGALRGALPGGANLAGMLGSRETVFAISVVVLSAKLAKCDGPVRRAEIDAFKTQFRIPPENMKEVGELFDRARDSAEGYEPYAQKLAEAFAGEKGMLEDVLAALFRIATADAPLNQAEYRFLGNVHRLLALDLPAWERASQGRPRHFGPEGARQGGGHAPAVSEGPDPYATLGLAPGASNEAVRAAWRGLIRENHPDALTARGMSAELVRRATGRMAEINAAWDRIKRERGL